MGWKSVRKGTNVKEAPLLREINGGRTGKVRISILEGRRTTVWACALSALMAGLNLSVFANAMSQSSRLGAMINWPYPHCGFQCGYGQF